MAVNSSERPTGQRDLLGLVGYNMKRAYMRIYQDFSQELLAFDLRQRTFSVLSLVIENPGISQSDIARSLGIERSGTVVIVDELEQRDLIRRSAVKGDKRAYALRVTAAGRKLYALALKKVAAHEERMLENLTAAERVQLNQLLQRIHLSDPERG
ncbi:MAG: MarR family transcriptional regulator [Rhodobacteraceae bacterium]|nr:MarR family transcriptional regulator [Paracoccaceae bacterium]